MTRLSRGTPTKRQVSKRQVSKRLVSKRLKRQVYKTSGLQNVRFTKRQVFKTSGCKMSGFKTSFLVNISKRPFSKNSIDLTYVMGFHKVCFRPDLNQYNIHINSIPLLQPWFRSGDRGKVMTEFHRFSRIPFLEDFLPFSLILSF
jgi:hypothetical protein